MQIAIANLLSLVIHVTIANQGLPAAGDAIHGAQLKGSFGKHNRVEELHASPYLTYFNSKFGPNIEGMSVNPSGEAFAVNFGDASTNNQIGQVFPVQKLIYTDPVPTAKFNGLQFQDERTAYAPDQNNTRLLKLHFNSKGVVRRSQVYCSDPTMLHPNDITISRKSGLIFLSAMNWVPTSGPTDGEIWVCTTNGVAKRLEVMGRVNGIELSVDENILYATESYTSNWVHVGQKIWQFDVDHNTATISNKRLFVDLAHVPGDSVKNDLDGIRVDEEGNLLAVRYGGSQVAVFTSQGALTHRIHLNIRNPTNLAISPVGERTLFVCGQCTTLGKGCVDTIYWPYAGRYWAKL